MLARITLLLSALLYLFFGILLFCWPVLLENAELLVRHPTAATETRAFYGGVEIGLGVYLLLGAIWHKHRPGALLLLLLVLSGTVAGRLAGAYHDGIVGNYWYAAMAIEAPLWLLAALSWKLACRGGEEAPAPTAS